MKSVKSAYHHGDLRQSLMTLGMEALEAKGPDDLSLRELARTAGVSPNAPYRHFESREELLVALIRQGFDDLALELEEAGALPGDELQNMGAAYTAFARQRPKLFRLMFSGRLPANPGESFRAMSLLGEAVRRRLPLGSSDHEVVQAALSAWTLVHGSAVLQMEGLVAWADPAMLSLGSLSRTVAKLAGEDQ